MNEIKIKSQQWFLKKGNIWEEMKMFKECIIMSFYSVFLKFWHLGLCSLRSRCQFTLGNLFLANNQSWSSHPTIFSGSLIFLPNHPRVRYQVDTDYAPMPRLFKLAIPKPVFSSSSLENHSKGSCSYLPFPFLRDNNIFSVFSMTVILRNCGPQHSWIKY